MNNEILIGPNNISGKVIEPVGNSLQVVCFMIHGLTGNMTGFNVLASELSERGITSVMFNCRGAGQLQVSLTIDSMIEDIRDAYQFANTRYKNSKFVVVARGIGALASLIALKQNVNIFMKIYWAGIFYTRTEVEIEYQRLAGQIKSKGIAEIITPSKIYKISSSYLESLKCKEYIAHKYVNEKDNLIIIHPEHDEVSLLSSVEEFIRNIGTGVKRKLITIPEATHPIIHGREYIDQTLKEIASL
ncbi:alpha/beta hydrolase [Patescibacteria group bacterium]|nr:alpha/beta hydrolase [Nanoarchaeota archaeon]MBU1758137.1 alpha/beta hydrolase [Patescibacteria group bacterium]